MYFLCLLPIGQSLWKYHNIGLHLGDAIHMKHWSITTTTKWVSLPAETQKQMAPSSKTIATFSQSECHCLSSNMSARLIEKQVLPKPNKKRPKTDWQTNALGFDNKCSNLSKTNAPSLRMAQNDPNSPKWKVCNDRKRPKKKGNQDQWKWKK